MTHTCDTCHWWIDWDKTHEWGSCVFLSGSHGEKVCGIQVRTGDKTLRHCSFRTRPTFGCGHWEKDQREREASE